MKTKSMSYAATRILAVLLFILTVIALAATRAAAAPPHPDMLTTAQVQDGKLPYYLAHIKEMYAKGVNTGTNPFLPDRIRLASRSPRSPQAASEMKVLTILVDFSDKPYAVAGEFFDSLMFDTLGRTVRDYYHVNSYGSVDMVTDDLPSDVGWQRAPQTYAYYVNGQNGTGAYPRNTQKLVEDLVAMVDADVDFSRYDNNGDGYVDAIVVVHAGPGAESTSSDDDIWSHQWGINPQYRDGVYVSTYTIQPEYIDSAGDMTIGVYCHELGHGLFGLPDLYDIDYSSFGIGKWGIMAFGSWLGPAAKGGCPAHLSAWSKMQAGFLEPVVIVANTDNVLIPNVEDHAVAYRLWSSGHTGDEYFLLENRQRTGYDAYLPSSGLLVWHIDEVKSTNEQEWWPGQPDTGHYVCALEQADGQYQLEKNMTVGDAGDPFPGNTNNTLFNALTIPSSDSYTQGTSFVAVENVSASADTMQADFLVGFSAGIDPGDGDPALPDDFSLAQNYPNPFNPHTTIEFHTEVAGRATLNIYNTAGQKVRTLLDEPLSPGVTTDLTWDGCDDGGNSVASGLYLYRLTIGDTSRSKKMILLR